MFFSWSPSWHSIDSTQNSMVSVLYSVRYIYIPRVLTIIYTGLFEYEEYISLKSINDPNEGYGGLFQSSLIDSNII